MQLGCNFAVTCHQELSELLAVFGLKSQPESASFSFIYRITEVPLSVSDAFTGVYSAS